MSACTHALFLPMRPSTHRRRATAAWHALRADATAVEMGLLLRSSSLLQTLGSTTVLAFPDKHGILSDGAPSIKQAHRPF